MAEFGNNILYFDCVTSTFDKLAEYEPENGFCVAADVQTKGIGRRSRDWLSDYGGAYFSFYILPEEKAEDISFLAIVCALCAHRTIKKYTDCKIKWPNDIVTGGKKLCGILMKSSFSDKDTFCVMAGVGINVNNTQFRDLDYKATSLKLVNGIEYDRKKLIKEFLAEFENVYVNMSRDEIVREYSNECITVGSRVAVHYNTDDTVFEGKCVRFCPDGSLDIELQDKIVNVNAGEVSVRGIYGYV